MAGPHAQLSLIMHVELGGSICALMKNSLSHRTINMHNQGGCAEPVDALKHKYQGMPSGAQASTPGVDGSPRGPTSPAPDCCQ